MGTGCHHWVENGNIFEDIVLTSTDLFWAGTWADKNSFLRSFPFFNIILKAMETIPNIGTAI